MNDQNPPLPLTETERLHYQSQAERGIMPDLSITRRFIATIRKSILASPKKLEKTAKTRNKTPDVDENNIDFF